MQLDYEALARVYVGEFAAEALPDARDVAESRIRIVEGPEGCTVDADIPTSADDCWLEFTLHGSGTSSVRRQLVIALRSGRGDDADNVYQWDERKGSWQLTPRQPEADG